MQVTYHKEHLLDRAAMLAMRALLAVQPRTKFEPGSRADFNALMQKTPAAEEVGYEAAFVGGVAGWWCRPASCEPDAAVLYLHGGAYVLGSAAAYRNFCGQIAARCGTAVFVADYALAPERPFPQAFLDAQAAAHGLEQDGFSRLVIAGDSAGGGLAIALAQSLVASAIRAGTVLPQAAVVFSPWTDLALTGESLSGRASEDPLLSQESLNEAARVYLGEHDPRDPRASALYGEFNGFPPLLLHAGEDEVLLDDARHVAERVESAGGTAQMNVWQGMTHVFASNLMLQASKDALDQVGIFIRQHLAKA